MANSATIRKIQLQLADMDRHYYATHHLTLAQHPSETEDRLAVRLLAFMLNASDRLVFSADLSSDEFEPQLAERTLTGDIDTWVAFGTPDEKWLRKASRRAKRVVLYTYGDRTVSVWWAQQRGKLARYDNLSVHQVADEDVQALAGQIERNMNWQCNLSDGQLMLTTGHDTLIIEPTVLQAA